MQSRLPHQGKKSHCLQRHGLTTGIGTCDHQQVKIFPQTDINGNSLFLIQQWMTALTDLDVMLSVENRLCGILFHGEFCLGKNKVQRSHDLLIRSKL